MQRQSVNPVYDRPRLPRLVIQPVLVVRPIPDPNPAGLILYPVPVQTPCLSCREYGQLSPGLF